ncbi:hypothetical protein JTB14_025202 [Gonioctena quinquepunctata]|nr:hypothetical protein JTB14_025202 [Gonioctena quinquepunctata]
MVQTPSNDPEWKFGAFVAKIGLLHYEILVEGNIISRHIDQIRSTKYSEPNVPSYRPIPEQNLTDFSTESSVNAETPHTSGTEPDQRSNATDSTNSQESRSEYEIILKLKEDLMHAVPT